MVGEVSAGRFGGGERGDATIEFLEEFEAVGEEAFAEGRGDRTFGGF